MSRGNALAPPRARTAILARSKGTQGFKPRICRVRRALRYAARVHRALSRVFVPAHVHHGSSRYQGGKVYYRFPLRNSPPYLGLLPPLYHPAFRLVWAER